MSDINLAPDSSFLVRHILTNPEANPIYVNDAQVQVTIKDCDGVEIPGETWPVELPYVAASNGVYEKVFDPNAAIIDNKVYIIEVEATGIDGLQAKWINRTRAAALKG